jgi:hypothetical protein
MGRYVKIGKETVYGTLGAGVWTWIESKETIIPDQDWKIYESVGTRTRRKKSLGNWRSKGNIGDFPLEPENGGELFAGAIGLDTVTPGSGGSYKHTFGVNDMLPSYSLKIGTDVYARQLTGCLVDTLKLSFPQGESIKATASILQGFGLETQIAMESPTFSTLEPFVFHTAQVKIAGSDKTVQVFDAELTIANNLIDRGSLGSRFMDTKRIGGRVISGKLSMYFIDNAMFTRFIAGTEFALEINYTGALIGSGIYYTLKIIIPKVILKNAVAHVAPQNEPAVLECPFEVFYDSVSGYDISIELVNTISTAYA